MRRPEDSSAAIETFFFVDYEGVRQIFTYQQAAVTLPDSEQRLGAFLLHTVNRTTRTTAPIPLYNPITGITYTSGDISSGSTPFALAVLAALPANNVTGAERQPGTRLQQHHEQLQQRSARNHQRRQG